MNDSDGLEGFFVGSFLLVLKRQGFYRRIWLLVAMKFLQGYAKYYV